MTDSVFFNPYLTKMVVSEHELWPYNTTLLIAVVLSKIFVSLSPGLNAVKTGICLKPSNLPILVSVNLNSVSLGLWIYHFKSDILKHAVFSWEKKKLTCVRICRLVMRAFNA